MTGLNIIDVTGTSSTNRRGDEIQDWLNNNPNVSDYVIIDDEVSDLNNNQLNRTIKTEYTDGFLFGHFLKLYELFGEKNEWKNEKKRTRKLQKFERNPPMCRSCIYFRQAEYRKIDKCETKTGDTIE